MVLATLCAYNLARVRSRNRICIAGEMITVRPAYVQECLSSSSFVRRLLFRDDSFLSRLVSLVEDVRTFLGRL